MNAADLHLPPLVTRLRAALQCPVSPRLRASHQNNRDYPIGYPIVRCTERPRGLRLRAGPGSSHSPPPPPR